jgi:hypothetical protein
MSLVTKQHQWFSLMNVILHKFVPNQQKHIFFVILTEMTPSVSRVCKFIQNIIN